MGKSKLISIDNFITTVVILLILGYFSAYFNIDFLNSINNQIQDFKVNDIVFSRLRNNDKIKKDTNIVIINIGNLNRKEIAREINIINNYKPEVIGVDVTYPKVMGPELDDPLAETFSKVKNLVLASKLVSTGDNDEYNEIEKSIPLFTRYSQMGYVNFITSEFRTAREFTPRVYIDKNEELAFSVKVAQLYNPNSIKKFLARNNESEMIFYERNLDKYTVLDWDDVMKTNGEIASGATPDSDLSNQDSKLSNLIKGKIVLFGFIGPELGSLSEEDNFYTPMNPEYIGKAYPDMYGVVIHANIISMILNKKYINVMPSIYVLILEIILCYLTMAGFTYMRAKFEEAYESLSLLFVFVEAFVILGASLSLLYYFNYYLDLKTMFFALAVSEMVSETYFGSLKPLTVGTFKKLSAIFTRK
jgi:CHASE2 domain-containing sensor protein